MRKWWQVVFCVALCLACGLRVDAAVNVTAPQDVRALASLKACVFGDGGGWAFNYLSSNWSDGSDPCTAAWFGVNCTQAVNCIQGVNCTLDAGGALRVRSVRLVSLSLQGDLGKWQVQEGELSELESLDLSVNAFRGTIPTDIRRLRSLRYLALGVNVLYGTLPSELGELTLLERFDIDGGFNPETNVLIQSWAEGTALGTPGTSYGNQLAGTIPDTFTRLTNLRRWIMHRNMLTGSLPSRLGDMHALRQVDLSGNYLSGSIPSSIKWLQNLRDFRLDDNRLRGSIPPELSECSGLEVLVLEGNELSGKLPPHMPPRMGYLDLHDNRLTGTIPAWQWNRDAPRIHFVFLHMNLLSGSIPWALTNTTMPYLEAVSVAYNAHLCGADPGMPHAPASFIRDECDHWDDALLWPTGCGLWPETVGTQLGVPCGGNSRKQAVDWPCGRLGQPCSSASRCCVGGAVCAASRSPSRGVYGRCVTQTSLTPTTCVSSSAPLWWQCAGEREGVLWSRCCVHDAVCAPIHPTFSLCVPRPA